MEKTVAQIATAGDIEPSFRQALIEKVWFELADHYGALATAGERFAVLRGKFAYPLMNGENPYQIPASVFSTTEEPHDSLSLPAFTRLSGVAPCFTNIADADCLVQTISLSAEAYRQNTPAVPYICVAAKHGNPCGFGVSRNTPMEALERALFGNPRAIWGGELVANFAVDAGLADALVKSKNRETLLGDPAWMLDIIMAPAFSEEAAVILGKRKGCKVFQNPALAEPFLRKAQHDYRFIRGGFLRQPPASYVLNISMSHGAAPQLASSTLDAMIIAWATAFSSNHGGNEVALAKNGALLGAGGGPSTVEAAEVAVSRAKAIVLATTHFNDAKIVAEAAEMVTGTMKGLAAAAIEESQLLQTRGW